MLFTHDDEIITTSAGDGSKVVVVSGSEEHGSHAASDDFLAKSTRVCLQLLDIVLSAAVSVTDLKASALAGVCRYSTWTSVTIVVGTILLGGTIMAYMLLQRWRRPVKARIVAETPRKEHATTRAVLVEEIIQSQQSEIDEEVVTIMARAQDEPDHVLAMINQSHVGHIPKVADLAVAKIKEQTKKQLIRVLEVHKEEDDREAIAEFERHLQAETDLDDVGKANQRASFKMQLISKHSDRKLEAMLRAEHEETLMKERMALFQYKAGMDRLNYELKQEQVRGDQRRIALEQFESASRSKERLKEQHTRRMNADSKIFSWVNLVEVAVVFIMAFYLFAESLRPGKEECSAHMDFSYWDLSSVASSTSEFLTCSIRTQAQMLMYYAFYGVVLFIVVFWSSPRTKPVLAIAVLSFGQQIMTRFLMIAFPLSFNLLVKLWIDVKADERLQAELSKIDACLQDDDDLTHLVHTDDWLEWRWGTIRMRFIVVNIVFPIISLVATASICCYVAGVSLLSLVFK